MAVAILVLQALAGERGSAGRAAQQESTSAHVGSRPDQIPDTLKSKHRVINKKRDRVDPVIGVGGAGSDKRAHRSGFGNAFF